MKKAPFTARRGSGLLAEVEGEADADEGAKRHHDTCDAQEEECRLHVADPNLT